MENIPEKELIVVVLLFLAFINNSRIGYITTQIISRKIPNIYLKYTLLFNKKEIEKLLLYRFGIDYKIVFQEGY